MSETTWNWLAGQLGHAADLASAEKLDVDYLARLANEAYRLAGRADEYAPPSEATLRVRSFADCRNDKAQAVKVLEEAAEAFAAWQAREKLPDWERDAWHDLTDDLADELADVVQAACNLAKGAGCDLQAAMPRCRRRNEERGRY